MKLRTFSAFCVLLLSSCGGKLPVAGLNHAGKPTEVFLKEDEYVTRLSEGLLQMEKSIIPGLTEASRSADEESWKLRTATAGFGVSGTVGIGPFKVSVQPRLRASFATGANPPIN